METKVIFFGTPAFVLPVLDALTMAGYMPQAVITAPDKPVGRKQVVTPPPVKQWGEAHGIRVLQPEKLDGVFSEQLRVLKPDVGIISAYGKIIPKSALGVFSKGVLNLHPSLLPRWRGPSPVQEAIAAGDQETGVTIMLTDEEIDHGAILAQKPVALKGTETGGSLTEKLFDLGADLLVASLFGWLAGNITPQSQDHSQATYTKLLTRDSGHIDWSRDAESVAAMVRVYDPWPGTFTEVKGLGRLKIFPLVSADISMGPFGQLFRKDGKLVIYCGKGSLILEHLQLEGRRPMLGHEFLLGHPEIIGRNVL